MTDVEKINVSGVAYDLCDAYSRSKIPDIIESSNTNWSWYRKTTIDGKTFFSGLTNAKTVNITNAYGASYYGQINIALPMSLDFHSINITIQSAQACFPAIISFTNSTINIYVVSPVSLANQQIYFNVNLS